MWPGVTGRLVPDVSRQHQVIHGHLPLQGDATTLPKRRTPIPSDTASHLRRTKPQLEGALPSQQEAADGSYPEPVESSPLFF